MSDHQDPRETSADHALAKVHHPRRKSTLIKTETEVFDKATMMALYKLQNQGLFQTLDYPISTGKEANVFHATTDAGPIAVKIYRVHTSTFNNHLQYILGDHRFSDVRPTKRAIVEAWAQKEYRNLSDILDVDIPVPTPIRQHKNIVTMSLVGDETGPAPALRDVSLPEPDGVMETITGWVRTLWTDAELVHGDLSEFNILVRGGREAITAGEEPELVLIDVGQAVPRKHPRALELLERDIVNVARYGKRLGVELDVKALFHELANDDEDESDEEDEDEHEHEAEHEARDADEDDPNWQEEA